MRISRSTGAVSGLLIVLLGIWGGIIPFVGPYFNYAFGSTATWHYTTDRLWLDILPAVAVVAGGLILVQAGHRVSGVLGGWLALSGGGWFIVGPAVSRVWEHGGTPIGAPLYGPTRQMLELVGYFYGVGALVVGLSAFALGRYVTRPALVADPMPAAPAYEETTFEPAYLEPAEGDAADDAEPVSVNTTTELRQPVITARR